jgi:hypothetical protein
LYSIQVLNSTKIKELKYEDHPILWEFIYLFIEEVPGLTLKIDLDFSIDHVPGAVSMSKVPYRMSTPKLGSEDETKGNVRYRLHKAECFPMGRTNPICKEEGWYLETIH